jgi:hypothetical protein
LDKKMHRRTFAEMLPTAGEWGQLSKAASQREFVGDLPASEGAYIALKKPH